MVTERVAVAAWALIVVGGIELLTNLFFAACSAIGVLTSVFSMGFVTYLMVTGGFGEPYALLIYGAGLLINGLQAVGHLALAAGCLAVIRGGWTLRTLDEPVWVWRAVVGVAVIPFAMFLMGVLSVIALDIFGLFIHGVGATCLEVLGVGTGAYVYLVTRSPEVADLLDYPEQRNPV